MARRGSLLLRCTGGRYLTVFKYMTNIMYLYIFNMYIILLLSFWIYKFVYFIYKCMYAVALKDF